MGLKQGAATKPIHHSKPTSKLSGQKYVTKPEGRHPTSHNYSVSQAESKVRGLK
jgi:hypothetical protein